MKINKYFLTLFVSFGCLYNAHAFGFNDILLWLPNRFMDLTDIISLGTGFCGGAKIGVRATRAIDFNAGDACYAVFRKDYNRWISISVEQGHSLSFLYIGTEDFQVDETWGLKLWDFPLGNDEYLHKGKVVKYDYDWWENPIEGYYDIKKGTRDWFEIAAEVGCFGYLRVAVHPIEILYKQIIY